MMQRVGAREATGRTSARTNNDTLTVIFYKEDYVIIYVRQTLSIVQIEEFIEKKRGTQFGPNTTLSLAEQLNLNWSIQKGSHKPKNAQCTKILKLRTSANPYMYIRDVFIAHAVYII